MKISTRALVLTLLAAFTLVILCQSSVFANKSWSEQKYSEEKGISVIGNENKYASIFGISIPQNKKLWTARMPRSQEASIHIEGDTVYIVGIKDTGLDQTIMAHHLEQPRVLWASKLKDYERVTQVIIDEQAIFFGAEIPHFETRRDLLYAVNKSDGTLKWETPIGHGLIRAFFETEEGNLLAVTQRTEEEEGIIRKTAGVYLVDKSTGSILWEKDFIGSISTAPALRDGVLYFDTRTIEGEDIIDKFHALAVSRGDLFWSYDVNETIFAEPIFMENNILVYTTAGEIINLHKHPADPANPVAWIFDSDEMPLSHPILEGDNVFFITSVAGESGLPVGKIYAINVYDGQSLWSKKLPAMPELPIIVEKEALVAGYMLTTVRGEEKSDTYTALALDKNSGNQLWALEYTGKLDNPVQSHDGILYIPLVYKARADSGKDEVTAHSLIAINLIDGMKRWDYVSPFLISSDLNFVDDKIMFGTKNGYVYAISHETGKEVFGFFNGTDNSLDSQIIENKGMLAYATQTGKYFILDNQGRQLAGWTLKPYFAVQKLAIFIGTLILAGVVSWFIYHARKGKQIFIRRIAGLNAIDEAVGRSTEMGRPVLYITGLADVEEIQTLASLSILGHISQKTAEYDTPLIVPCCRSVVMSTAQEVVKEAYLKAGRPDTYRRENIHYLTDDQFGYVAGVDGIMVREKPAANFYMGKFYAESLILAETGHSTGAIQIAGTAEASQLPFFVAACDYTLIGEELFAASAYLSKDPLQIGSLKGQDTAKAIILGVIILGCLLSTLGIDWLKLLFTNN